MENVKVIIQKVVAILTVIIIIMTQYVITGLIEATYAIDLLATQSTNVQFRAYFKNGEEEITEIESSIAAKDLKLKIDVAVKNQGYFNGQISLENAGFKLTQATANDYISKVENNVIYLNQINAEETASIEVGIEYLGEETIAVSTLMGVSTVKLKGTYTSSEGNVTIDSGSDVKVNWKIPEGIKAELAAKVQTNSIYKIGEENKKIVQYLISSKISNNAYPVKTTEIKATIPEGATKVEVHKRTTKATNGEQEFTASNYSTDNNILTITVNNSEVDGKISWMKGVQDIYVVTYEYPEGAELSTQSISINGTITTQDIDKTTGNSIAFNAEQVQLALNESKDGIASISKVENESEIYKGKIYAGEARDITSYSIVYVDYVEGLNEIEITENEPKFVTEVEENGSTTEVESSANVEIKAMKINKEKVASVLGNEWNLTVGENQINKNTDADESGNITLPLAEGTKTITIKTSKPVNNGSFIIETTKEILNTGYTREQIKEFTKLKDNSSIKYVKNNNDEFRFTSSYNIGLKETESKASLQTEQKALTASEEAQQLNLTVVLESSGEQYDLYKNPTIKIKLPSQIKNVTFSQKPQLMYANNGLDLTEGNYTIEEENGQKIINIKLTGEQTSYLGDAVQGATLFIKTNVNIDPKAKNSEEEIVLTYTNENATKYADNGTQKINVQIIENQVQNDNQNENNNNNEKDKENTNSILNMEINAQVGGKDIKQGETVRAGEIITYKVTIANNGKEKAENITVTSTIPDNTTIIEVNPKYPAYNEEIEEYTRDEEYLIKKEDKQITLNNLSIDVGKSYTYTYRVMVNENLAEDITSETKVVAQVKESNIEEKFANKLEKGDLKVINMPIYREPSTVLNAGFNYIYEIHITNLTNQEKNNVDVQLNINDALDVASIAWNIDEDNYEEINAQDRMFTLPRVPANGTVKIIINTIARVNSDETSQISAIVKDAEKLYRSNVVIEKVQGKQIEASLAAETSAKNTPSGYVNVGDKIVYSIKIKNTGKYDAQELVIEDQLSNYLELVSVKIDDKECNYTSETNIEEDSSYNIIRINSELATGKEITVKIEGTVDETILEKEDKDILNKAIIYNEGQRLAETNSVSYIVLPPAEEDPNEYAEEEYENENNNNNNNNSNGESSLYTIKGTVWNDEDQNGERDSDEKLIEGIKVYAINISTNKIATYNNEEITATTNGNGEYTLNNLPSGEYIVAFEYDTGKYMVTMYKADGVSADKNSDAVKATKNIDGNQKTAAYTDIINVITDLSHIDLGLSEAKTFSLKLEKTISKVIVTNSAGTNTYNFKDTNLAKVEIASKNLKGSNVLIEYKIKVTNNGEVAGYAKKIVDYIPSSLTFNSKLNSNWYKKGKNLYTTSLANSLIKPGETREIKIILTKKMTESNTGITNNKAEIESYYNSLGLENSESNNSEKLKSADIIVGVKTGIAIRHALLTLSIIIIIGVIAYLLNKRLLMQIMETYGERRN